MNLLTENEQMDREVEWLDQKRNGRLVAEPRIKLVPFNSIKLGTDRRYLVKGLIPYPGLTVIWGPPKCGKSFWTFDLAMHVALGREYRGRRIQQGPVVYCCFEGQIGFQARAEAFRQKHIAEDGEDILFYLMPVTLDLVKEYDDLIGAIRSNGIDPAAVVLDTLNRSLNGSENSDEDMSAYIKATDAIRDAFNCSVLVVHHCGINDSRPRGHTSLTGAADARLAVTRDVAKNIIVEVEFMKDGESADVVVSALEPVDVGYDEDGDVVSSCVVVEAEAAPRVARGEKLNPNAEAFLAILRMAGRPLSTEEWNEKARAEGLGLKRPADLVKWRAELMRRGLIYQGIQGWSLQQ
jgi:hypothetical protein